MTRTIFGTAVGLALGMALAFGSFGQMLVVALFMVLGGGVAKALSGELDLMPYISGRRSTR
ncbi:hypothetical protein GCM10010112_84520 [Actinoplanes lobatus]|uniref:DUF2273 domain-containing protein n=2 Tax=Actinoplanes TaxID=1865 RepID=A0A7W7HKR4_9ACTN|nr:MULTISPECIES: DUF2273 domain-containing protein [Actinoplanes]MBB4752353.1 hypothetical protein [Actinoplanes lobatus]MBW6439802.1 hypothetical protein [Actinoplanes hulinensis]GGN94831.1 hypothetical protein GCM10010112_84520 [Actinoplanes lobatus]GIE45600.1 hypothetical protein Alo02nite_84980 [Actinoplanes lobatus]